MQDAVATEPVQLGSLLILLEEDRSVAMIPVEWPAY
jgi:hypothetical protein